jgi:Mrp family chromosome partitioning ATPase
MGQMPKTINSEGQCREFQRLIYALFQGQPGAQTQSTCVAFTSALPGEGVSHVVREIGLQLAKHQNKRTLIVESRRLESLGRADLEFIEEAAQRAARNRLCVIDESGRKWREGASSHWQSDPQFREHCLQALSKFFNYILVDCSAISTSATVVSLAPLVDGVVLVVEAGRSTRSQIHFAQNFLHSANAEFLGYVLNKRKYPVPEWLHARL